MMKIDDNFADKCINTIRVLSADMVEKAKSGHPGAPMGCAPIAHLLFSEFMKYSPENPDWYDRDRFVLSNGHASALLYSMLHLTGYDLSLDDLKDFRQLGSKTPGHPENLITKGVEVSTGPLGQGISNAVGMAIAEKHLGAVFNKEGLPIVDHYTYVLCGDGCLQEGISSEASSLAGHLGLGKLIVCYDDNRITIDGDTALCFTEDVLMRYTSYGWHVQTVDDVNDIDAVRMAIESARLETNRPSLIKIRTVIGYGCPREGSEGVHGAPLGSADLIATKTKFGFDPKLTFFIPEDVKEFYLSRGSQGQICYENWNELLNNYKLRFPELSSLFERRLSGKLPDNWKNGLIEYSSKENKVVATRNRSEEVLNCLANNLDEIFGGSADLTGSNLTALKCSGDFQKDTPQGRYLRYGVREHAMAAISNGLFAHGGFRPFCATFLQFIGYALGAVRVSALSGFGVLYIMTHDSIGLGEDGPTHQPIEILESLRAIPNLLVFRPADGNETVGSYIIAMQRFNSPSVFSFSRQASPTVDNTSAEKVSYGAYIIDDFNKNSEKPDLVIVSTGTELVLSVNVAKQLSKDDNIWVRVVSMPCWELFEEQPLSYQLEVFPDGSPILSIEASTSHGWKKYAHTSFGVDSFGVSAPSNQCFIHFGFTVENLVEQSRKVVSYYSSIGGAQSIVKAPKLSKVFKH